MAESDDRDEVVLEHPNRDKASSKLARVLVVVLLLASAALVAIISLGGWSALEGAKPLQLIYIVIYLVLAFFVLRWSRGVLPMIAAFAIVLAIFGAVAAPGWFSRDKTGYATPALPEGVLGLLCALLVPLELALIVVAMLAFRQGWNVEVERPREERDDRGDAPRRGGAQPAPA
jgi:FtsH-binding integral membrane protein